MLLQMQLQRSLCVCVCTRDVVTNAFKLLTALNTNSLVIDQLTACVCMCLNKRMDRDLFIFDKLKRKCVCLSIYNYATFHLLL